MVSTTEVSGGSSGKKGEESLSAVLVKDSKLARELKSRLSALGSSKDSCIRQLREVNPKFRSVLAKVRELREARDKQTAVVKELKAKREAANNEMRLLSPEVKKALEAKEAAVSSLSKAKSGSVRKSASQLYSEMESLEMRIITEAMPFSREQEVMKLIKEKRKQLEAVKAFSEAASSHRELFSKFSELRGQSYSFHSGLRQHAAESQKLHEEMVKLIPQLKELRQRRELLLEQLDKAKGEYSSASSSLSQTLHELSDAREKIDIAAAERKKQEIEQTEAKLTEKLKSGKKLTTRDLMMLRG
ncbi:hypothetical protein HYU40_00130 [Candidatus Woesearchaeota archaeon]|nr:hypothetical protein [Candidatus Woesearchaeota archaeon]